MTGMEIGAALGFVGTKLFEYNRKNFEFDQDQRFEREELRLNMQVERFKLFREDIRDLVNLTVGKMDLYHLVCALFLKMCVIYYCEGVIVGAVPPYLLLLYYLAASCAFVYLLLAVWLSMHASIAAHSYGTRLLTRFVRLPIPSSAQMSTMNARYADFEFQGKAALRVPFLQTPLANNWKNRPGEDDRQDVLDAAAGRISDSELALMRKCAAGKDDLLGQGVPALIHEEEFLHAVEFRTERHVQLFRALQAKWQCFDAYARVCMALGMRHMLQAITFFLIGVCTVEQRAPTVACVMVIAFQAASVLLFVLDIYGTIGCCQNVDLQVIGVLPAVLALVSSFIAPWEETEEGISAREWKVSAYTCLPSFAVEVVWFQLLLWVSTPTRDDAGLPRYWRSVLFMDVFSEGGDPSEVDIDTGLRRLSDDQLAVVRKMAAAAQDAFTRAEAALRRWEAVPDEALTQAHRVFLKDTRKTLTAWLDLLVEDMERRKLPKMVGTHGKAWGDLTPNERQDDPFVGSIVGPFEHYSGMGMARNYYFDPESQQYRYELEGLQAFEIITQKMVRNEVARFAKNAEAVCNAASGERATTPADADEDDDVDGECFPIGAVHSDGSETSEDEDSPLARTFTGKLKKLKGKMPAIQVVPVRLPWVLYVGLTRVIQLVWLVVGIMVMLGYLNVVKLDKKMTNIDDRRLAGRDMTDIWPELVDVEWPFGSFFRPRALFCGVPKATRVGGGDAGPDRILVRGRAALYELPTLGVTGAAAGEGSRSVPRLTLLPGLEVSSEAVVICAVGDVAAAPRARPFASTASARASTGVAAPASQLPCLLAEPAPSGVYVWSPELGVNASHLHFRGRHGGGHRGETPSWRLLAGSAVPCDAATSAPVLRTVGVADAWCMLLAGWADGAQSISLATALLPHGLDEPPVPGTPIVPLVELPLPALTLPSRDAPIRAGENSHKEDAGAATIPLVALHMDPLKWRLVALDREGRVLSWDLSAMHRQPTAWRLRWLAAMVGASFRAEAVCSEGGRLLVAGRSATAVEGPAGMSSSTAVLLQATF